MASTALRATSRLVMTCTPLWTLDPAGQLPLIGAVIAAVLIFAAVLVLDLKAKTFQRSSLLGGGLVIAGILFGPLTAPLIGYGLGLAAPVTVEGPGAYEVRHSDGGRIEAGKLCVAGTCSRLSRSQVGEVLVEPSSYPAGTVWRLSTLPYAGPLGAGDHPAALARCG
jgi:hypothetical protein